MARTRIKISERMVHGKKTFVVDLRSVMKKGKRHFFSSETEAQSFVEITRAQLAMEEDAPVILVGQEKRDYLAAKDMKGDATWVECVLSYRKDRPLVESKLFSEALDQFLVVKRRAGKHPRYLQNVKNRAESLLLFVKNLAVDLVTHQQIEAWVHSREWESYTRNRALIDITTFFNFCKRNGWCFGNPVSKVERIEVGEFAKGILTPAQAKVLLETCMKMNPRLLRYFADQLFGFMREEEARTLLPENVKADFIELPETKTREVRYIEFNSTWKAWREWAANPFYWPVKNHDKQVRRVKKLAKKEMERLELVGADWWYPLNCLRHSACSYGAVKFGAEKAARWAGHSEAIQKRNYRRPITAREAEEFWGILPEVRI